MLGYGLALIIAVTGADKPSVVVKVNNASITSADVEFSATQQGVDAKDEDVRKKLVERLIDRQLIRGFLASKKIEPAAPELEIQIGRAEDLIRKRGEDPKKLLAKIGYTQERLKSELGLSLAWQIYIRKTVTTDQIKQYFEKHRQEIDGTNLRASQILLKLPKQASEVEVKEKKEKLAELRKKIVDKSISFEEAAKQNSEAPSKEEGGDVGLFGWRGQLPAAVSEAAFALAVEEISEPIVSPFGVHLIQVTERHPGKFSIEDVRSIIVDRISEELWDKTVRQQRSTAKIVWEKPR